MVDVDHRPPVPHGLLHSHSHATGLCRLTTRGSAITTLRVSPATMSPSYPAVAPLPSAVLTHLAAAGVSVLPGLSNPELFRVASSFLLTSATSSRSTCHLDGFPNYRSPAGLRLLRFTKEEVPAAVATVLLVLPGSLVGHCSPPSPPLVPLYG